MDSYEQCAVAADASKDSARVGSVNALRLVPQSVGIGKQTVMFTYDVQWYESDVRWAARWNAYLRVNDMRIHWYSIINSLVVVLFLAGIVAVILLRALRRDIAKYNKQDELVSDVIIF